MRKAAIVLALAPLLPVPVICQTQAPVQPTVLLRRAADIAQPSSRAAANVEILSILSQTNRPYSRASQDTLAAGLVDIAISGAPTPVTAGAIATLVSAGKSSSKVPYAGALERLTEIYERGSDVGVRGSALSGIAAVADRTRALRFLESVVVNPQPEFPIAGAAAVRAIALSGGAEGKALLQRVYRSGAVKNPLTWGELEIIARNGFEYPRPK